MAVIDPSTSLGKLRLRCSDWGDLPFLPDSVYLQTLIDTGDNLPESAKICATYILGMLSFKVRRKMAQLEVFNDSQFKQYKEYLLLITKDPAFMQGLSPLPYAATSEFNHIVDFQKSWNKNYYRGSEQQALSLAADISPNDGSRTGPYGQLGNGWTIL
jgi:hypothetical protein